MITELQISTFVRDKVSFLAMIARDAANSLKEFAMGEFSDEGTEQIDDRDVTELLASLDAMERDPTLWVESALDHWMPRNAYAAMLQANLDEYYRYNRQVVAVEQVGPIQVGPFHEAGGESFQRPPATIGIAIPLENRFGERLSTDLLVAANLTPLARDSKKRSGKLQLNKADPRWVLVLQAKAIKRRRGAARVPDNSGSTAAFSSDTRMVILGDWGSGLPNARKLAQNAWQTYLLPQLGESHAIHLGDVYYAGLAREYKRNFLADWPVPPSHATLVSSWCLPGNHDMFSGGQSYFDMLSDKRFARQNQSSYFLLENEYWQVFGLDTASDPRDYTGNIGELYGEQAAWVAQKRANTSKKCLLLTHHQPFSAYEPAQENLERRLRPVCSAGQVDAWFWGHEHLCAVYDSHQNVRYPVLLGHSGFPEKPKKRVPGGPSVKYEWNVTDPSGFLLFGFAVLDFDKDRIHVQLVDEDGRPQCAFVIV